MRRVALALLLAAACGSPCGDLGTRICNCQPAGSLRDSCNRAVSDQISKGNPKPGSSEQDFCKDRLNHCADPSDDPTMCDRLLTTQGRIDCGLAYGP